MATKARPAPRVIFGTLTERATCKKQKGDFFVSAQGISNWNGLEWIEIPVSASRYWVSPYTSPGPITGGPFTFYQTIQAAVDAAVADGHDDTMPVDIFLLPGDFAAGVVLQNGIGLRGFDRDNTTVLGPITGTFTGGHVLLEGFGTFQTNILFGDGVASRAASYTFRNLKLIGHPVVATEPLLIADIPDGSGPDITIEDCFIQSASTDTVNLATGAKSISVFNSTIVPKAGNRSLKCDAPTTTVTTRDSKLQGRISTPAATIVQCQDTEFNLTAASTTCVDGGAGGTVILWNCRAVGLAAGSNIIANAGQLQIIGSFVSDVPLIVGPGCTSLANPTHRQYRAIDAPDAVAGVITPLPGLADLINCRVGGGGAFAFNLPAAQTIPEGDRVVIRNMTGAGPMNITKAGADTIDGGAGPLAVALPLFRVELQRVGTDWQTISVT